MTQTDIFVKLQQKWIELNKIKDGDKVRITRNFVTGENGCACSVDLRIADMIGEVLTITDSLLMSMQFGIHMQHPSRGMFNIPYFCLEPVTVEKPVVKRPKVDRVYEIMNSNLKFKHDEMRLTINDKHEITIDKRKLTMTESLAFIEILKNTLKLNVTNLAFDGLYDSKFPSFALCNDEMEEIIKLYKGK